MTRVARIAGLLACLAAHASAAAQTRPRPAATPPAAAVAIVGARVETGSASPLENATIVIRGERIESITAGGAVPSGAREIDARGAIVTPGFVATATPLGLVEISLEASTTDAAPDTDGVDPVRAAFAAADGFHPASPLIPVARLGGVTSAVSTPIGGLVPGTSAWIDLRGSTPAEMLVRPVSALNVSLDETGIDAAGGAMPSAISRLRELLEDARLYGRNRAAYDRRALREMRVSRVDLERLQDALAGRIPIVVRVSRAADILRVLEIGRTYGLRIVLSGAEEAWRVAADIAAADVPVIVQPLTNLPTTFARLGSRYDNAAILDRAGVRLVFTTDGAHDVRNLRQEAGNAVAFGVRRETALRALTSEPARVFGGDERGEIAAGRIANLVVWSGDPFELTTHPLHVFVRGEDMPLRSRQTVLLERYRDLSRVRRGR